VEDEIGIAFGEISNFGKEDGVGEDVGLSLLTEGDGGVFSEGIASEGEGGCAVGGDTAGRVGSIILGVFSVTKVNGFSTIWKDAWKAS